VPIKAITIPTEQISRYFHIASIESELLSEIIRNEETMVVASIAIHIIPILFDSNTMISID
jgi:hypothetical protein